MQKILLFSFLFLYFQAQAQYGCPDPQALNYDPQATINNGSCIYPITQYTITTIDTLAPPLEEISGLIYFNGKLYGHNDSGNDPILYELDTLGNITKEIFFKGINNNDWEDITQDDTHIYIADIGNNSGNRTNLKFYKFLKSDIGANYYDTILESQIEKIKFSYPDQLDFTPTNNNTRFDCEAVAYRNGLLHLFTKNWTGGPSVHYTVPNTMGTYLANRLDSLNTDGILITAADFAPNKQLMLLGYAKTGLAECALWYIYDFNQSDSFFISGNKRKINIGYATQVGQIESVCFKDSNNGFIANEHFNPIQQVNIPQQLFSFSTKDWFPYTLNTGFDKFDYDESFTLNTIGNNLIINNINKNNKIKDISVIDLNGKKIIEKTLFIKQNEETYSINLPHLATGIYTVRLTTENNSLKFFKFFFQND